MKDKFGYYGLRVEPTFDEAYARVCARFEANAAFREDVLAKVGEVIFTKTGNANLSPEALREGAQYLLKEFAFLALARDWFGRLIAAGESANTRAWPTQSSRRMRPRKCINLLSTQSISCGVHSATCQK